MILNIYWMSPSLNDVLRIIYDPKLSICLTHWYGLFSSHYNSWAHYIQYEKIFQSRCTQNLGLKLYRKNNVCNLQLLLYSVRKFLIFSIYFYVLGLIECIHIEGPNITSFKDLNYLNCRMTEWNFLTTKFLSNIVKSVITSPSSSK